MHISDPVAVKDGACKTSGMSVERSDWDGLIGAERSSDGIIRATAIAETEMPPRDGRSSGSGAFKIRDDSGHVWWVKPLNNPQGPRVPINEKLVGRAGALVGASVPQVS